MKNVLLIITLIFSSLVFSQASDTSRAKLHILIDSVENADVYQYDTKDNLNNSMDAAQIISNPNGGFMSVYHHYINGQPRVFIATSSDFLTWTIVDTLAFNASQPTMAIASDGGYIVAWEQEPSNHIRIVYYNSLANLFSGTATNSYDVTRTLSTCAEGTPNIYSASSTFIDLGFHYYDNCNVDKQARGTLTNFTTWNASVVPSFDNALLFWGVQGNIGDREQFVYDNYEFALIEGQYIMNDFGSFRTFIYDYQTGNAEELEIITHNGSTAFANPTITFMEINNRQAMVVTLFMPSEGAANGEAGELTYYRYLEPEPIATNINQLELSALFLLFPNPSENVITIQIDKINKDDSYEIFNLIGERVLKGKLNKSLTQIDISQIPSGCYFILAKQQSQKFIKE